MLKRIKQLKSKLSSLLFGPEEPQLSLWVVGYKAAYANCIAQEPLKKGQLITVWGLNGDNVYLDARPAQPELNFAQCRGIALEDVQPNQVGRFQKFFNYYDYPDEYSSALLITAVGSQEAIAAGKKWLRKNGEPTEDLVFDAVPFPMQPAVFADITDIQLKVDFNYSLKFPLLSVAEGNAQRAAALAEKVAQ